MSTEDVDETSDESYDESTETGEEGSSEEDAYAEPKKPFNKNNLVIVLLLAGVVGVTYFMVVRSTPSTAHAGATAAADPNNEKITKFLGKGQTDLKMMQDLMSKWESVKAKLLSYPSTKQVPLENLQTNPFQFSHVDAPQVDLDAEARAAQQEELINEAKQLHVQSVLVSSTRRSCIIDGKVYNEGQNVGPFKIVEIKPNSIVLSQGSLKLELTMAQDQPPQAP